MSGSKTSASLVRVRWVEWGFTSCKMCDRECLDEPLVDVTPKDGDEYGGTRLCVRCVRLVAAMRIPQSSPAYLWPFSRRMLEHIKKTGDLLRVAPPEPEMGHDYKERDFLAEAKSLEKRGLIRAGRGFHRPDLKVTRAGLAALAVPAAKLRRRVPPKEDDE